jgi:putative addiction module killer protein
LAQSVSTVSIGGRATGFYLAKDGEKLIVLLGGGTKQRQQSDIDRAKALWAEYKMRKAAATSKRER